MRVVCVRIDVHLADRTGRDATRGGDEDDVRQSVRDADVEEEPLDGRRLLPALRVAVLIDVEDVGGETLTASEKALFNAWQAAGYPP